MYFIDVVDEGRKKERTEEVSTTGIIQHIEERQSERQK